jgi:hypothetical protein
MIKQITELRFSTTILAAIAVTLYWMLPLSDPDYFWHLKTGELVFTTRAIPTTDPFSFTMQGEEWILHEWLFQLLLFLSSNTLGDQGVRLLISVPTFFTLYFIYKSSIQHGVGKAAITVLLIWLLFTLIPFISPRPQLASYVFFAYFLYAINIAITTNSTKHLLSFPPLMVVWVNLHGGYIIGITLLLLATASNWLSVKSCPSQDPSKKTTKHLAITFLLTLIASALNPHFIQHWAYPFYVFAMDVTPKISEWQSPNFRAPYARSFLILILLYVFFLAYSKKKPRIERIIIPLFFLAASLTSARNIPFALISISMFFPKFSEIDTDKFQYLTNTMNKLKKGYTTATSIGPEMGRTEHLLNWIILALVAIIIPLANLSLPQQASYPQQAADYFINNKLKGNILNEYQNGGYLIQRLFPAGHVFIDGRADMYGDKIISEYSKIVNGTATWESLFYSHPIDYVICRNDTPIRQLLLQKDDFKLIYSDNEYSIVKNLHMVNNAPSTRSSERAN